MTPGERRALTVLYYTVEVLMVVCVALLIVGLVVKALQ